MKLKFIFYIGFVLLVSSGFSQTTDTLSSKTTFNRHRFTPDYNYLLLNVFGNNGQTQKTYNTNKKEFIDWDNYPKEQYQGHEKYNLYERYNREGYYQTYLSTVKNTGKETRHIYDMASHRPIISVPRDKFIRLLADGSFLCREEGKKGRGGNLYILSTKGKKKVIKTKPGTSYNITYDGKYGVFNWSTWNGSKSIKDFEIQNMLTGKVLDFKSLKYDNLIEIAYVTDSHILYESWNYYILADWDGNEIYKLDLDRMKGSVQNLFNIDDKLYIVQRNTFQLGQEGGEERHISVFHKKEGAKILDKSITNAVDIVPIKDNEFMVLYRDYNENLSENYDVNLYAGIGEGIAVEYLDNSFEPVEFKYLQNSTRQAVRKKRQPLSPAWVTGIRKYQVVEHDDFYKMVIQKELFGFRLSDNTYVKNDQAENIVKLANQIDPNSLLCDCINKRCHEGYVQNVVTPAKQYDTKFVKYVTTSSGLTYKKTTTFKAGDDSSYSYETKCNECNGDGFYVCKTKIPK